MLYDFIYCDMSWQTSQKWQNAHTDTDICLCSHRTRISSLHSYYVHRVCDSVLVSEWSSFCFRPLGRTLRYVTQDVSSSPVSPRPSQVGVHRGGYQDKITSPAPDSTVGRGGGVLALRTSLSPWETTFIK